LVEKGSAIRISKEDLEKHYSKVDEHMNHLTRGRGDYLNLFDLLKSISKDKHSPDKEVAETIADIREGFGLYYEMYSLLEDKVQSLNSNIDEAQKREFLGSYSMFAASSLLEHNFNESIVQENELTLKRKENFFPFQYTKDDNLRSVLVRYYGVLDALKGKELKEGKDLQKVGVDFFRWLKEESLAKKSGFDKTLVDLVEKTEFKIADEFTIVGYELSHSEKVKPKVEFVQVLPFQVAGNVLAKQEMLRDMDRIALFDLSLKKNPIIDMGGLSWSVLYDGPPGTGKSTLFRMGLTRLNQRCEQMSEFWKSKNMGKLHWKQLLIDQSIKNEYYGKTGQNLLDIINQAKKTDGIYIITTDDLDLLVADRNANQGGSDKDILNILMQFADGINTVIIGNVQWWAATNDATAMDGALRQRFIARYFVDGPVEWYDFADILYDKLKKHVQTSVVDVPFGNGYTPYEMRKGQNIHDRKDGYHSKLDSKKGVSFREIGELCKEMKDKNPKFTGRAVHAVSEAIKKRINDYDIPEDYFTNPDAFFNLEYEQRIEKLTGLCKKVTGSMIVDEYERYFESEQRYASDRLNSDVDRRLHEIKVHRIAIDKSGEDANGRK